MAARTFGLWMLRLHIWVAIISRLACIESEYMGGVRCFGACVVRPGLPEGSLDGILFDGGLDIRVFSSSVTGTQELL